MKVVLGLFVTLLVSISFAQSIGVKDIPADGDTTISVKKGNSADNKYEVTSGEDDVEGEEANLIKEARASWKKACADWKKELKELNKDNQVLSMNCGKMVCSTEGVESTCRSKATYKLKIQVK
ncbi:hypothetical protein B9G69_009105 [Bdellovibrio sp. SKB1291214]|uniref:hypothetical protein n=1 Tax=Bdellovibrio sp. SKB1291214 TaxID=1732569 RepID=UPI0020CDCD3A|nr:hypothetical protein [Bdellovibrio sp. SKB1291214]UYL10731.1 hypothetical protein B9G69_009105 [Bdellovibrio sp. SKB1291214]